MPCKNNLALESMVAFFLHFDPQRLWAYIQAPHHGDSLRNFFWGGGMVHQVFAIVVCSNGKEGCCT